MAGPDGAATEAVHGEPYRVLFPLGVTLGLIGAAVWPATWLGLVPWPGTLHAGLMVQGFELAFIAGFLLTFVPRVTRTLERARPADGPLATAGMVAFGGAALAGWNAPAQAAALLVLVVIAAMVLARLRARRNDPPEEFGFVPFGLLLGIAGTTLSLLTALGIAAEPAPRFGLRLVTFGMVLPIVLGIGGILVPTFLGIKDPLFIAKIARPHQRHGRRILYAGIAGTLLAAFACEAAGARTAGEVLRAIAVAAMILWVWKSWRRPRLWTTASFAMWVSGWFLLAGFVATAVAALVAAPFAVAFEHLALLGGFGFLTAAMGARVTVTHGGHAPDHEVRLVNGAVVALLLAALACRLLAGWSGAGPGDRGWLAGSGVAWMLAWGIWLVRSFRPLPKAPRPAA